MTNADSLFNFICGFTSNFLDEALFCYLRVEFSFIILIHFASRMCMLWLRVWYRRPILSCQDLKSSSSSHSAISLCFLITPSFILTSQLLLPAMCTSQQFGHLDSFRHLFVLSLVWSFWFFVFVWQLWHIMGGSWYLYTAVYDGCPGIKIVYACPCRLKVTSTAVVLELLDLMKLASIGFPMNGYASFRVFSNYSLISQFCR